MEAGPVGVPGVTAPELRASWNHGLSKAVRGKRAERPFACERHGWRGKGHRARGSENHRSGIISKAPDLTHRMPRPARLGWRRFLTAGLGREMEGGEHPCGRAGPVSRVRLPQGVRGSR